MRVRAQVAKTVTNGLGRHALQPQAADRLAQRLGAPGVLLNQAEDQLALAPGVAGIDDLGDVFAFGQLDHRVQARLGFVHGFELKVRRNDRQVGKTPFAALDVKLFGRLNLHQVTHRAGDDVGVAFKVLVMLFELARRRRERTHDVLGYRGLFSNHQGFT